MTKGVVSEEVWIRVWLRTYKPNIKSDTGDGEVFCKKSKFYGAFMDVEKACDR